MTSVVIVDDEHLVRAGLRLLLSSDPDVEVLGEASDGRGALEAVRDLKPDVLLLDLRMPTLDGVGVLDELARRPAGPRVLVLTTFGDDRNVYAALRAGAAGFLLKTTRPDDLRRAVHAVAAGESVVAPAVLESLVRRFVEVPAPDSVTTHLTALTERELDVLRLVARGLSNREISSRLFLSETTVKSHLNHILGKLGLRDRVQAAVLAYEAGLVRPGVPDS